ncbi:stalk domain-containing protein [Paenibacillus sp. CCS19]|uniref:stalk domain-containing protein n=1 Tax=Paenibacillus sp. CCS19 TaxID=3158387 RepID=UPI00295E8A03|nr:stalk domain-containing protein [Paenibacillus cellulosilyticus]
MRLTRVYVLLVALALLSSATAGSVVRAEEAGGLDWVKLYMDKALSKDKAYTEQGQWMVPIQSVIQGKGSVKFAGEKAAIRISGLTIELTTGSVEAKVNGERIVLPAAPEKQAGKWYMPSQIIKYLFGFQVTEAAGKDAKVSILRTRGPAAVFGYAEDRNGEPVKDGLISFCTGNYNYLCLVENVKDGFYRAELTVGVDYSLVKLSGYENNYPIWEDIVDTTSFKLKLSDHRFRRYVQPEANVTIQVVYEDGKPVNSGSIDIAAGVNSSPYQIKNGQVQYSVSEKTVLRVTSFKAEGAKKGVAGIYGAFAVDPSKAPITLKAVIRLSTVKLRVIAPGVFRGGVSFFIQRISPVESTLSDVSLSGDLSVAPSEGPELEVSLPDGEYAWSYSLPLEGMSYRADRTFVIRNGKAAEAEYVEELPRLAVTGQVKGSDGSTVSDTYLAFWKAGTPRIGLDYWGSASASCRTSSTGTYSLRLQDGEYTVVVYDSTGTRRTINEKVTVTDGKANITALTLPSS